jgi:beta-lactamase class A
VLRRLLGIAALGALTAALVSACGLDVADESGTPAPTQPAVKVEPIRTARASPGTGAVRPAPFPTPSGSTGLLDLLPGPLEFSDACLDGSSESDQRLVAPTVDDADEPKAYKPIAFKQNKQLQQTLDAALADEADDYAYVVKDLRTGEGAMHNPDKVFNSASVFKLWVMYEVFHQQSLGLLNWNDELVVSPYYDSFALSPRRTELCQQLTVADALDAMLSISDNAAAVLLQDLVGSGNVNRAIEALGVKESGLFEDGLPLTASDVALLLEAIGRGQAVSSAASSEMLLLMSREGIDDGLVDGVPPRTLVAHKTGNWSDATHDVGIVYGPKGPYLFVALSDTDHETSVIKALSEAAYAHYAGQ